MRLTTVILIASLMQVSAATFGQRITMSQKNAPLESVLKEIRKQSGYNFFYDGKAIPKYKKVTVLVSNASLDQTLDMALKGLDLTYEITGKSVSIKVNEKSFIEKLVDRFQEIDITGKVLDETGRPVPGATVRVKNGRGSAITDVEGVFMLKDIDPGAILVISYVGYNNKEVAAAERMGNIRLELATSKLDEVQVMAYGTTSRRLSTSNISTVKAADIEKQPVTNVLLALQGRVPGLVVNQSTGFANAGVTVRIQGQNTIDFLRNSSDPLYVIDGVPYPSQMVNWPSSAILGGSGGTTVNGVGSYGNPLSFINPATIESVDILKDADATAIYGSRAANGAILITTKKGKAGQTKVDASMYTGFGQVANKIKVLNTEQYLEMRREAYRNDGLAVPTRSTAPIASNYDLTLWDPNRNTDWQEELLGGNAKNHNIQASVSGGTPNTQFLVGANYHKETTVFPGDYNDRKASVNFSINNVSANQKFRLQMTGSYMADDDHLPQVDLTPFAVQLVPNAPALFNADGSLNWEPYGTPNPVTGIVPSTWANPLSYLKTTYNKQTSNLVSNVLLSYQLIPGLDLKSAFGFTSLGTDEFSANPVSFFPPEQRANRQNSSAFTKTGINTWLIEPQATYKRAMGKGSLEGLFGATFQQNTTKLLFTGGSGYSTELLMKDLESATTMLPSYSRNTLYRYNAFFGRLSYNLMDKYVLNVNARRDGSSRFGGQSRFHTFGSVAGAWIFSAEDFIKNSLPFLSFGKIRASYGTTGNDQIGDYRFLNLYSSDAVNGLVKYQGASALAPKAGYELQNPDLAWEETRKLQGGIDLGFFKDRLLLNATYYRNRSSNQLLQYNLPILTGAASVTQNFPATVQNYGWELSLNSTNIRAKDFAWSSNINLNVPKNTLIAFDNLASSSYANLLVVGEPLNIRRAYPYLGVNPQTGLYEMADKNGNPTTSTTDPTDRTSVIDLSTRFNGGFQNTFSYKGMQLDFLFQFAKQKSGSYRGPYYPGSFVGGVGANVLYNQPVSILDRWQQSGDESKSYQRLSVFPFGPFSMQGLQTFLANAQVGNSDYDTEDASYIRLKNVSLSWALPERLISRIRLNNLRVFAQGQNLVTFTGYTGLDPEARALVNTLPPLRVYTFGLQVGL